MAKIENYSNDTNITDNDRLFGTSVDGAISTTANFKLSELKTFMQTGLVTEAYADQAEADAIASSNSYTDTRETAITSAYQTYADQAESDAIATAQAYTNAAIEQKFALRSEEIAITSNDEININIPIDFASFGSNPNSASLKYDTDSNDSLILTYTGGIGDYIENTASATVPVKISFSMFTSTGSNATNLTYRVEESSDNGDTWTEAKTIIRSKSGNNSNNVDSFFLYYGIAAGDYIRFTFAANHTGTNLQGGSWIEVVAINA